jgi:peptidyl-prolyl cis-trans isomerase SurA
MIRTIPFAAIALLLSVLFAQMTANAGVTIIATVNGKPITNYDVEQRSRFLGYATNIEITDQNRDRLYEDSLQLIIEDKLRLEAARDMLPDIEAVVLPQARDFINQNFGNDTTSGNRVLMNDGIDPLTVQQKYTSDLAWSNFISTKFLDKFENIEERVDDEIDRMRQNASKPQIKLAEIVLTPSPTRNIEQTRGLAGDMVAAIRKGASFTEIARQYSVSGSSARGGDVGWAMSEKLPKAFRDALESIENGAVTEPVLLDGAVYILRKSGERKDGIVDASQSRVWLARAILPLAADASDADRLEAGARIVRDTESVTNCEDLGALNATYESNAVSRLNDLVVGDLAPQMQKLVASLEIGVPSEPLSFAEGVASMMVCKLLEPQLQLPPREEIRQALIDKIFGSLGERQLQRLRRTAIIERRDG